MFISKYLEKITDQHISDDNNHHFPAGNDYMVSNCLTFENFDKEMFNTNNRKTKSMYNVKGFQIQGLLRQDNNEFEIDVLKDSYCWS